MNFWILKIGFWSKIIWPNLSESGVQLPAPSFPYAFLAPNSWLTLKVISQIFEASEFMHGLVVPGGQGSVDAGKVLTLSCLATFHVLSAQFSRSTDTLTISGPFQLISNHRSMKVSSNQFHNNFNNWPVTGQFHRWPATVVPTNLWIKVMWWMVLHIISQVAALSSQFTGKD